jgi:hypothetical protein
MFWRPPEPCLWRYYRARAARAARCRAICMSLNCRLKEAGFTSGPLHRSARIAPSGCRGLPTRPVSVFGSVARAGSEEYAMDAYRREMLRS